MNKALTLALAAMLLSAGPAAAGENLVKNPGFEDGMAGWKVIVKGPMGRQVDVSRIVSLSTDARTGKQALLVDTASLNPSSGIPDELATERPQWDIYVTQMVPGLKGDAWYLAKFQARGIGVAVDSDFEFLADLKPWTIKKRKGSGRWANVPFWVGRVYVAAAPMVGPDYRQHVLLKQTYPDNNAIEVGIRIQAPWTGKVLIDDIELVAVDPEKDLTKMQKYLAFRGAEPFTEIRKLHRQTTLVENGQAKAAVLIGTGEDHKALGQKIRARIQELTGASVSVVSDLKQVPAGAQIVAVGSMLNNDLVARLHFNGYVKVDALAPGPGGYVVWSVPEPYGLAKGQNVIVVGGSDATGQSAAVDHFCEMLKAEGKTITLGLLHKVAPEKKLSAAEMAVPTSGSSGGRRYEYRTLMAGFSKWFLEKWLETGDLEVAKMARQEMLDVVDKALNAPYNVSVWDTQEVGFAWDCLEELPVLSDEDRLRITNLLLGYAHDRVQAASGWRVSRFMKDTPLWNHQAKGLVAVYTIARHFQRYYGDQDARFQYYLKVADNAFRQAARYSKPQENSGNYWQITMKFCIDYYLGEWDKTFFESGALRRYAEYTAAVHNNTGGLAGFGDTYYCYHGASSFDINKNKRSTPLGFWFYRDPKMLWWTQHVTPGYRNPYHQDVEPVEWKELLGVKKIALEEALYSPSPKRLRFWGAGGEGTDGPINGVTLEQVFDKITFRQNWDPEGDYLCLEGNGRGIHSQRGTNQICKLTILGKDILIGSTYKRNNARTYSGVLVTKDVKVDDPKVKGTAPWEFVWWAPLNRQIPSYAALETMADLPTTGFSRTTSPRHMGTVDWHRNIFWSKGKFFVVLDEMIPEAAGTYHLETNYATCPRPRNREPNFSWKILDDKRTFEIAYQGADGLKQYICSDGASELVIDPHDYKPQSLHKTIVRQQLVDKPLQAAEATSLITLFYGDKNNSRKNYRLERLGTSEGIVFQGDEPVAYFGCAQGEKTAAILPIQARMFLLTADALAVVDATKAGSYLAETKPVSREIDLPAQAGKKTLGELASTMR